MADIDITSVTGLLFSFFSMTWNSDALSIGLLRKIKPAFA